MIEIFVPGRLCLFGEHADWAGGYRSVWPEIVPGHCITAGTDQGILSTASPCPGRFRARAPAENENAPAILDVDFTAATLAAVAREGGFWSYAAGTALAVLQARAVGGLNLTCRAMDLPMRKGLSSSAAVCVTVARAFNQVYGLDLAIPDEMELAYRGEKMTPSRCGRMDQVCAYGQTVSSLVFDGDRMQVEPLALGGVYHLLVVDLGGEKDTIRILSDLNDCFRDRSDDTASGVRNALGPLNRDIAHSAAAALTEGNAPALGYLMTTAQEVFDRLVAPACPDQLRSPLLHRVLAYPPLRDLTHGGKGVGSQGDGCAQLVCRGAEERSEIRAVLARELAMRSFEVTLAPEPLPRAKSGDPPSR
ncbi:MAG: GHMP kinase [Candidatus Eisenbacteria bacterium]|nr:GHMP kinase [Candidatus Eisenbacteria bacterium]